VVTPKVMTGVFLDIQMLLSRVVICKAEGARDITGKAESGRADRTRQRHRTPRRDAQQFRAEIAVNESKPRNFSASGGKPPAAPAAGSGSLRSPGSDVRSSGGP